MAANGIDVDVPRFKREVQRFAKKYGLTAKDVMLDQMRLWAADLANNTPHKSASYKKGREAVKRDCEKVFGRIDTVRNLNLLRKIAGSDTDIFGDVSMRSWHQAQRSSSGRVKTPHPGSVKIGKWTFTKKPHVTKREFNAYVRKRQKSVGRMRAGWLPGILRFGAKRPATWVTRHGTSDGAARDMMKATGSGYLEMSNRVPYARRVASVVAFTARKRVTDLTKHLHKRLAKLADEENRRAA